MLMGNVPHHRQGLVLVCWWLGEEILFKNRMETEAAKGTGTEEVTLVSFDCYLEIKQQVIKQNKNVAVLVLLCWFLIT